jgi:hypothetical protein
MAVPERPEVIDCNMRSLLKAFGEVLVKSTGFGLSKEAAKVLAFPE